MNLRLWLKHYLQAGLRWLNQFRSRPSLQRNGREISIAGREGVRLDTDYAEWISPLNTLPAKVTIPELETAVEALSKGEYFFPANDYLEAVKITQKTEATLIHRCRAQRTLNTFRSGVLNSILATAAIEPDEFLIYNTPQRPLLKKEMS